MPLKRSPVRVSLLPEGMLADARLICGCQSGLRNPRPRSYTSALARGPVLPDPPETSTLPLRRNVADWPVRAVARLPVVIQLPLAGSYASALVRRPVLPDPPATNTLPLGSKIAV